MLHSLWQSQWEIHTSNKLIQIKSSNNIWSEPQINFNKHDEVMITIVRSGHIRLTHSYLLSENPAPSYHHTIPATHVNALFWSTTFSSSVRIFTQPGHRQILLHHPKKTLAMDKKPSFTS